MDIRDAFGGGIVIGGLRNMLEIKILICYILSCVGMPITREQVCESLQQTGLVNYFDANTAIDELLDNESVTQELTDSEKYLVISSKGKNSAHELESTLLPGVRDRAVQAAISITKRARYEKENKVHIQKVDNGYDVTFEIENKGVRFFTLTLNLPDSMQANQLREGFLNNPGELYSNVIETLLNNLK